MEEGRGVFCCGGVEGGFGAREEVGGPGVRGLRDGTAGDGEAARNISRSAASSLLREDVALNGLERSRAERATSGEGVRGIRGGEERICRDMADKGRSESSSSECDTEIASSGIVDTSVTNERAGMPALRYRPLCRVGEDSGSWWCFFQEFVCACDEIRFVRGWCVVCGNGN
jgi:hypothetical protein